jgi:hypothetical protein
MGAFYDPRMLPNYVSTISWLNSNSFETGHANSRRRQPSLLCLQQKDKSGGRLQGKEQFSSALENDLISCSPRWQVYQITAHKIHVYDESDEHVESRSVPLLLGRRNKDEKKGDDILANFDSANKKPRMDINL